MRFAVIGRRWHVSEVAPCWFRVVLPTSIGHVICGLVQNCACLGSCVTVQKFLVPVCSYVRGLVLVVGDQQQRISLACWLC